MNRSGAEWVVTTLHSDANNLTTDDTNEENNEKGRH